ncbi:hypothetical protein XELAEV_18026897mg [Xenopus laevis]|uniref:Uncharacterized protein n=1 Tax=Xenopus laevis TaxID=8355 RepID=A0A974CUL8_XENLA|nr:hypothetical protein XELAEV_18026897mg [Xenopus laevis]
MGKIGRAPLPQKDKTKDKPQTLDTYLAKETRCTVQWSGEVEVDPTGQASSQDHAPKVHSRDASLIEQFKIMLCSELDITSKKITSSLSKEIREIGRRTDILESRMYDTTTVLEGHKTDINGLRYQLQELQDKIEDMENRSCHGNIRIRGLPETYKNLEGEITEFFFTKLAPHLTPSKLEFDRIHSALGRQPQEGNPRDVILKLHYYSTKETIIQAARQSTHLNHDGHVLQLISLQLLLLKDVLLNRIVLHYFSLTNTDGPFHLVYTLHIRENNIQQQHWMRQLN